MWFFKIEKTFIGKDCNKVTYFFVSPPCWSLPVSCLIAWNLAESVSHLNPVCHKGCYYVSGCEVSLQLPWEYRCNIPSLCNVYAKYQSCKKCCKFRQTFPDMSVPNTNTLFKNMKRLWTTGLVLDRERACRRHMLTEEKLDETGARL